MRDGPGLAALSPSSHCLWLLSWATEAAVVQSFSYVHSLSPHALQHTRLPCPSLSPGVCSDSCPLSRRCHPSISFSVSPLLLLPSTFPSIRVRRRAGAYHLLRGPSGREPVPTASRGGRGQHFPPHWPPHRRHTAGAASASWQSGRGWLTDRIPGRRCSGVCSPWTLRRTSHLSPAELLWPVDTESHALCLLVSPPGMGAWYFLCFVSC